LPRKPKPSAAPKITPRQLHDSHRWITLDEVAHLPGNPNRGDTDSLDRSLEEFGWFDGIVIHRGVIIAGNHRYDAAAARGEEGLPGYDLSEFDIDDARRMAMAIVHNATTRLGRDDPSLLSEAIGGISALDAPLGGMVADLAVLGSSKPDARREVAMPSAGGVSVGEVWDVGPHRLIVGDATDSALWEALPSSDMLVTDPPYGIGYTGGPGADRVPIVGDDTADAAVAVIGPVLDQWLARSEHGAMMYMFGPSGPEMVPLIVMLDARGLYRWGLVWVKDHATFGRADFHQRHEMIFYGWNPNGPRKHPPPTRTETTVLEYPRPKTSPDHPTQKPLPLISRLVELGSSEGDVVLDPFAGSGTTLVAAAKTGRIGVGFEREPGYANVALERLEKITRRKRRLRTK
jgi:site-specific DNA-methyltransferase (adenine-specific)